MTTHNNMEMDNEMVKNMAIDWDKDMNMDMDMDIDMT
jgi:hypothetical protein